MHRKESAARTGAAASEIISLGGGNASEGSTPTRDFQQLRLQRRFGLTSRRAELIADLAMGGAA